MTGLPIASSVEEGRGSLPRAASSAKLDAEDLGAATWTDLGLSRPTMRDLKLGLAAFAAAVIPIYTMQAVLTQFTDQRHPIVEMLEQHMNLGLMAVSSLAAIIVAPFVEELLFRVALQGWLESFPARTEGDDRLMPWPIVISSLVFALAHLGNVSYRLGKPVPGGTRPSHFGDNKHVTETLESFEAHLKESGVDFDKTKFFLGQELTIDPKTELSTDKAANQLFTREYRKGFELPTL